MTQPTLEQFVRHAEKFGTEQVYETAEQIGLSETDSLALHLRRIDSKWSLGPDQQARLLDKLWERGLPNHKVSEYTGIPLRTVERASALRPKTGSGNRINKPKNTAKSGGRGSADGGDDFGGA